MSQVNGLGKNTHFRSKVGSEATAMNAALRQCGGLACALRR